MTHLYSSIRRYAALAVACVAMAGTALAVEPITVTNIKPVSGSVTNRLKQITLTLANAEQGAEWKSGLRVPVLDASGNQVTYLTGRDAGTGYILNLKDAITTAGTYTMDIPAGAIYAPDWSTETYPMPAIEGSESAAFSLTYTVAEMGTASITEIKPATGSSVSQLKQINCKVTGGDDMFGYKYTAQSAKVYNEAGEEVTYLNFAQMPTTDVFKLKAAITAPGKYKVVFPAGALVALDEYGRKVLGTESKELTLNYNVVESPAMTFVGADPENASTVASLSRIKLTWAGGDPSVGYGLMEDEAIDLFDVINKADNSVATKGDVVREGNDYYAVFAQAVAVNGEYKLTIPAGALWALDADGNRVVGNDSPQVVLNYTVDTKVGVESAEADSRYVAISGRDITAVGFEAPSVAVYDTAGRCVMSVKASECRADLSAGVYIVKVADGNGSVVRRVVIK